MGIGLNHLSRDSTDLDLGGPTLLQSRRGVYRRFMAGYLPDRGTAVGVEGGGQDRGDVSGNGDENKRGFAGSGGFAGSVASRGRAASQGRGRLTVFGGFAGSSAENSSCNVDHWEGLGYPVSLAGSSASRRQSRFLVCRRQGRT